MLTMHVLAISFFVVEYKLDLVLYLYSVSVRYVVVVPMLLLLL